MRMLEGETTGESRYVRVTKRASVNRGGITLNLVSRCANCA